MAQRLPKELLERAREMRREPSPAERRLWQELRTRKLEGCRFTRQLVVGPYVADFACRLARLVIELDGDSHGDRRGYDERRTIFLEQRGYRVLRFSNAEVHENLNGVVGTILEALRQTPSELR